jgi:Cu2+-containing amine oxidase
MLVNRQKTVHPLLTLQPQEVTITSDIIRQTYPGKDIVFRIIAIKEPRRSLVVAFLEAERSCSSLPHVPRRTYVSYQFKGQPEAFEDIADLGTSKVIFHKELPKGVHPPAGTDDMLAVQQLVLEDELVKAEIARLKSPKVQKLSPKRGRMARIPVKRIRSSIKCGSSLAHWIRRIGLIRRPTTLLIRSIFPPSSTMSRRKW